MLFLTLEKTKKLNTKIDIKIWSLWRIRQIVVYLLFLLFGRFTTRWRHCNKRKKNPYLVPLCIDSVLLLLASQKRYKTAFRFSFKCFLFFLKKNQHGAIGCFKSLLFYSFVTRCPTLIFVFSDCIIYFLEIKENWLLFINLFIVLGSPWWWPVSFRNTYYRILDWEMPFLENWKYGKLELWKSQKIKHFSKMTAIKIQCRNCLIRNK